MNIVKPCTAIFYGLRLCLGEPEVRSIAKWPWIAGVISYIISIAAAFYFHPIILSNLVDAPSSIWSTILYWIVGIFVALLLLVATLIASVVIVLIFTSVFQTAIAARVLVKLNEQIPEDTPGLKGIAHEAGRTITVESLKLLWLIPLFIILFILGLVPLLTPFAVLLASWLLAFQFVDITLDIFRLKSSERLRFCIKYALPITLYGLSLTVLWAIPFVGWVLPPAACAGAAWLLSSMGLIPECESSQCISESPSEPDE